MYNAFLKYLLDNNPEKVLSGKGIFLRKLMNPVIRLFGPFTTKYRLKIVKKANLPQGRFFIFAPTHGFKDDVLFTVATIPRHAYILFGSLPQFFIPLMDLQHG